MNNCSAPTKASAYLSLVHLTMEYASCVWDPHEAVHIKTLGKVQQQASRWVLADYGRQNSITRMLTQLGWPTLQHCCFIYIYIDIFYKIIHEIVPLTIQFYCLSTHYPTRQHHSKHLITPVIRPPHIRRVFTPEL